MQWETVIGLEIHVQLATQSKIFSGASTAFGAQPNSQACAVDLGLPGVLPVLNAEVVTMAVKFGLAIGAHISRKSIFARKNYFYPDLPKNFQITQLNIYGDTSIGGTGTIMVGDKKIHITTIQLEEDPGRLI